jgi:tryptophan synthase alpha chain
MTVPVTLAATMAASNNRIDRRFKALREAKRKGLVPFFTCGDPSLDAAVPVMHALVEAGADVIELGVPFSDPMADGPVIQRSSERALRLGVGLRAVLGVVREFRRTNADTPVVLMGYLNPIEIYGYERFAKDAVDAGVDGALLVDAPIEESAELQRLFESAGLRQILLASPTTAATRIDAVSKAARGFLYYVSFAGITGADGLSFDDIGSHVDALRAATDTPIAIGFGIKVPEQAKTVAKLGDAVVVGSALVEAIASATTPDAAAAAARAFLAPFRAALDGG